MAPKIIRGLALLGIPLALGWVVHAPGWDSYVCLMTVISGAIGTLYTTYRGEPSPPDKNSAPLGAVVATVNNTTGSETYATAVGRRMNILREKTLRLTLREMAELLELESVSELESYEAGVKEFPLGLLARVERFFRISKAYIDKGEGCIFEHFHLSGGNVSQFLKDGFQPILACCPSDRGDLLSTLVFSKEEAGCTRLAVADRYGSFVSNGGGRTNIEHLIGAMLELEQPSHRVRIIRATQAEWDGLMNGTYYHRPAFPRWGSADYECMDIFDQWFKEYAESRARWRSYAGCS